MADPPPTTPTAPLRLVLRGAGGAREQLAEQFAERLRDQAYGALPDVVAAQLLSIYQAECAPHFASLAAARRGGRSHVLVKTRAGRFRTAVAYAWPAAAQRSDGERSDGERID